jgi:hypothetical protein
MVRMWKSPKLILLAGILLCAGTLTYSCLFRGGIVPPPDVKSLPGVWVATDDKGFCFYRMSLQSDGTGLFAATFRDDPPMLYRMTSWHLEKDRLVDSEAESRRKLDIELGPVEQARPLRMEGQAGRWTIRMKLSGEHWSRTYYFTPERDVESRLQRTKKAMKGFEDAAGSCPAGATTQPKK